MHCGCSLLTGSRPGVHRVVVTGVGAISPVGLNASTTWQALLQGQSGVAKVTHFDASNYPTQIAAEVKGFNPSPPIPMKEARRMARCSQFALVAATQAVADAGENLLDNPDCTGVLLGTAGGGHERASESEHAMWAEGTIRVNPFALTASLSNMAAFHIGEFYRIHGHNTTVVTACASGTQGVGEAYEIIRRGDAQVMLAGGMEALIHPASFAGFCAMRAFSTRNDDPPRAARPFASNRDGFVMGEGAAVLVLENLEHALARGARIYAEIEGYAATCDAYHVAVPDPEGYGAILTMTRALAKAGLAPNEIQYINAHAAGTPLGDAVETRSIHKVFGEHAGKLMVSATKSMLGHCMGAAGALEALACVMSIWEQKVHPTINLEEPDPECDLDYVPGEARSAYLEHVLSNSFGLGGQNACLVIGRFKPDGVQGG
ncbi:MAG: beta-ketoacyl-ACP synthase II [Chloroflexi bacterium]|nr:beta-ketoacyl-ACP synthase II [Chloroflexota bacterium]